MTDLATWLMNATDEQLYAYRRQNTPACKLVPSDVVSQHGDPHKTVSYIDESKYDFNALTIVFTDGSRTWCRKSDVFHLHN